MVIRFTLRRRPSKDQPRLVGLDEMRLESHPSGLNRTDARRLTRSEIAHRERMLQHLHRTLADA